CARAGEVHQRAAGGVIVQPATSSPAQAGDPVATDVTVITGCPACAGHDDPRGSDYGALSTAFHSFGSAAMGLRCGVGPAVGGLGLGGDDRVLEPVLQLGAAAVLGAGRWLRLALRIVGRTGETHMEMIVVAPPRPHLAQPFAVVVAGAAAQRLLDRGVDEDA